MSTVRKDVDKVRTVNTVTQQPSDIVFPLLYYPLATVAFLNHRIPVTLLLLLQRTIAEQEAREIEKSYHGSLLLPLLQLPSHVAHVPIRAPVHALDLALHLQCVPRSLHPS